MEKNFKCLKCEKEYKSNSGLWKHQIKCNKEKNTNVITNTNTTIEQSTKTEPNIKSKEFMCMYCLKLFGTNFNKIRHQNNCQMKNVIADLKDDFNNKFELLKKDFEAKATGKVYNKYVNSGTINNKITINKIGNENLELTNEEVRKIFNKEVEGLLTFIEFANFNERLPNNHSFCSTSLESKYLSKYNADDKTIQKDRKKYYFDQVINKAIDNLEFLYNKFKTIFKPGQQKEIEEKIINIKNIKSYDLNSKFIKKLINQLNLLSYNKKDMVMNTWNQLYYDSDSDTAENFEEDLNKGIIRKQLTNMTPNKKMVLINKEEYSSDSDLSDSSNSIEV